MSYWKLPTLHVLTNLKKTKIMYDSNSFVLFHSIYILLIKESDSITVLYGCLCVCMCVQVCVYVCACAHTSEVPGMLDICKKQ